MAIISFTSDDKLQKEYIDLPYKLYDNDHQWIPPQKSDQWDLFNIEYPNYEKDGHRINHFIFKNESSVLGRVSAFKNRELSSPNGDSIGSIGQFECVNDFEVAKSLLSSAITWLKQDSRIKSIWGPMNFDIWHGYRFMTKGFDHKVFAGEPYNKFYYPEFFNRFGFLSKRCWHTIDLNVNDILEKVGKTGTKKIEYLKTQGYEFGSIQMKDFPNVLSKIYNITIRTFSDFPGYTRISKDDFVSLFMPFKHAFHSNLTSFLFDPNCQPVGYTSIFLDVAQAIRSMNGKNSTIAKLRFLSKRRKTDRVIFYLCGILPEVRHKKVSAGIALFTYALMKVRAMGYKKMVFALMSEDNKSQNYVNHYDKEMDREYQLYEYRV
jgi:hypothetical protein